MGKVIPFSGIEKFVNELSKDNQPFRAIFDTNLLIAASYEIKDDHEKITTVLDELKRLHVECFATVTTKAEFMEFHRRLMLTETLIDLSDEGSRIKMPKAAIEEIKKAHASVKSKQARDGSDPIFNDSQIKKIKSEF